MTTAVPPIALRQEDVIARAAILFDRRTGELDRLLPAFRNTGIETRYSCVPLEWYERDHTWSERNRLYVENAIALLETATRSCLEQAGRSAADIDGIVVVSTTGLATPSLDALLLERLPFRRDILRLPIFGLGCAGGVLGLARAADLARAATGRRIVFLVVELCALTFRKCDQSKSNIIAAALFGDGAAAVLLDSAAAGPAVTANGEYTWPKSLDVMGWHVEDDGLGVLFSRDIPALVRARLREAADRFLSRHDLTVADMDSFVCHPGGAKVIDALESAFSLRSGSMHAAREVLRDFGNMSAATVIFVLKRMLDPLSRRYLLSALGPGFTAGFLTLDAAA